MEELLLFIGLMALAMYCIARWNKGGRRHVEDDYGAPPKNPYQYSSSSRQGIPVTRQMLENPDLLAITIAMKRGFERGLGGTILINTSSKKTLAVEFYGPSGRGVEVEFVQCPNMNRAKVFLRGEEFEMVRLQPAVFNDLTRVLLQNSRQTGRVDVGSGCMIYEGTLPC